MPLGLLGAFLAYRGMLAAAAIYGQLLESAFDVHRVALYQALRWPLPENPAKERSTGRDITTYLYHGSTESTPIFTNATQSTSPSQAGS